MKQILLITLCILAFGCTSKTKKDSQNANSPSPGQRLPAASQFKDTPINVQCTSSRGWKKVFTLASCGHKTAQTTAYPMKNGEPDLNAGYLTDHPSGAVGEYWCEDDISDKYAVRVTGWVGSSSVVTRITYTPGGFSGVSPIDIKGSILSCEPFPNK